MDRDVISSSPRAQKLDGELDGRFVKQDEFYDHINETVFKPVLGVELKRHVVKDIVVGICNQVVYMALSGARVRLGRMGTFFSHIMPAGSRYNPSTKSMFKVGERRKLAFKPSKSTKKTFGLID